MDEVQTILDSFQGHFAAGTLHFDQGSLHFDQNAYVNVSSLDVCQNNVFSLSEYDVTLILYRNV